MFIYDLGLDYYTQLREQVNAVTSEQALAVAKKYLVPDSLVVVAVGDRKDRARAAEAEPRARSRAGTPRRVRSARGQLA